MWYVDTNDLILLDNVETTWRGVQDFTIEVNSKNEEETLLGLAITSVSFGLWCCQLKNVNRDPSITPEKFMKIRKEAEAKLKAAEPRQPRRNDQIEIEKPQIPNKQFSQEANYRQEGYSNPMINYQNQPNNFPNQPNNYPHVINPNQNINFQQMPSPNQYQPYPNGGFQNPYLCLK